MSELKKLMDKHMIHLNIDNIFLKELTKYYYKLFTKDENTLSFFGDGLWGVYPIYFTVSDINEWYDHVLDIDDLTLRNEVKNLFGKSDLIDVKWRRANDIVNLTLFYIVHRFLITKKLSDNDKIRGCTYCLNILHYKFTSSLQQWRFKYPADKSTAVATYAQLTKKYLIKVHGSWKELFDKRALDIIDKKGIHYKTLIAYSTDYDVISAITEIQDRIRKMANGLTEEFNKVKNLDKAIGVRSKLITGEEGERIVDNINQYKTYRRYIENIIGDRKSFIKDELVELIERTASRLPQDALREVLEWISDNSHSSNIKLSEWLDDVLEYAFKVISENKFKTNDLSLIISKLRSMYLSSRVKDKKLIESKETGLEYIEKGSKFKSRSAMVTLRSSAMLYVVLRTLTMKYFS